MTGTPGELRRLAGDWREIRAPAGLRRRLQAPARAHASRVRSGWLLPAAVASAATIVAAIAVFVRTGPEPAPRVATGIPSMSHLRSRPPPTSLARPRIPTLGEAGRVPTLPKTPKRKRKADAPAADADDQNVKS